MIDLNMIQSYAPEVAPQTIQAIMQVESGGNPLAVHVNGLKLSRKPANITEAIQIAKIAIRAGFSVDLGLMQINSRNLPKLGYTVEQMFDSGLNIKAGATILLASYQKASQRFGNGQVALQAALSAYNTGNFKGGFRNGYVAKYYGQKRNDAAIIRQNPLPLPPPQESNPYTANTTIFISQERKFHEQSNERSAQHAINPPVSANTI